ncbi:hypothetical protein FRA_33c05700 [Francisella sp. W12-1067]|nr:hypothetical protein FRA_33c05700 [Francisella sp. W12-1067]
MQFYNFLKKYLPAWLVDIVTVVCFVIIVILIVRTSVAVSFKDFIYWGG